MTSFTLPHPVSVVYESADLDRPLQAVPRSPGVYAFYTTTPPPALAAYAQVGSGLVTLYVGKTGDSLCQRVEQHLFRDARVSTLRGNFGLVMQAAMHLELIPIPGSRQFCFKDESRITDWLRHNTFVGFSKCDTPSLTEAAWLERSPGLLNISGCAPTPLTAMLRQLRSGASGRSIPIPSRPQI